MRLVQKLREFLKDRRTRKAAEKKDPWEQSLEEWRKLQEENRERVHREPKKD